MSCDDLFIFIIIYKTYHKRFKQFLLFGDCTDKVTKLSLIKTKHLQPF